MRCFSFFANINHIYLCQNIFFIKFKENIFLHKINFNTKKFAFKYFFTLGGLKSYHLKNSVIYKAIKSMVCKNNMV
jgi:hypothetical protein